MDNFDSYNVLLVIATNIPVLLMTGLVLQGHIFNNGIESLKQCTNIFKLIITKKDIYVINILLATSKKVITR